LFEKKGPNLIYPEIRELKESLKDKFFCWKPFQFNQLMRGYFLNLVDPMMQRDGYLISVVRAEDISPQRHASDLLVQQNQADLLEIKLSSSESQKVKRIQEFVCARYKISPSAFLYEVKKKSRAKSVIRDPNQQEDSLVGEYYQSHEMKTPMKSIKLFNMNSLKPNITLPNLSISKSESMSFVGKDRLTIIGNLNPYNSESNGLNPMLLERINAISGDSSNYSDSIWNPNQLSSLQEGFLEIDVGFCSK
jgi:hypothetical protein